MFVDLLFYRDWIYFFEIVVFFFNDWVFGWVLDCEGLVILYSLYMVLICRLLLFFVYIEMFLNLINVIIKIIVEIF